MRTTDYRRVAAAVESLGTLSEWLSTELLPSATTWVEVEVTVSSGSTFFIPTERDE